ncbi:MAG TPA: creatininase family protein [Pyrinomonadaceae bacterium]|jgi:creatinine amidohydrolase
MKNILLIVILAGILCFTFYSIKNDAALAQSNTDKNKVLRKTVEYPTMLDMTFPEFEAAAKRTDVALLPIGAIEEHGSHLPLGTDAFEATAQVFYVQNYLRERGTETIIGPPLNIGITNEADDRARDGTYMYPGSLTIGKETFVALYLDVLRSLHDNGINRVFLYSGHLGGRHLLAIAQVVEQANKKIDGIKVYGLIESERLEQMKLAPSANILPIPNGQNFGMLTELLGKGSEQAFSTHGDGTETSLMLYFQPEQVRSGYKQLPQSPSSRFFESIFSGDRTKNPSGTGGFPFDKASATVGKRIVDYHTPLIGDAILRVLKRQ